jgi:hypothetical protein
LIEVRGKSCEESIKSPSVRSASCQSEPRILSLLRFSCDDFVTVFFARDRAPRRLRAETAVGRRRRQFLRPGRGRTTEEAHCRGAPGLRAHGTNTPFHHEGAPPLAWEGTGNDEDGWDARGGPLSLLVHGSHPGLHNGQSIIGLA